MQCKMLKKNSDFRKCKTEKNDKFLTSVRTCLCLFSN